MSLLSWLAGLFGGEPAETVDAIAERLERVADRFANAGDALAEADAREAAREARMRLTVQGAKEIEAELLLKYGLRPDGRPLPVSRGEGPDGTPFVRSGRWVRTGGSRGWRYNNPGYVRCSDRSSSYGAISCDGEFAIFPNWTTGQHALRQELQHDYPGVPVGEALQRHLPAEAGPAGELLKGAGLDPATSTDQLTLADCERLGALAGGVVGSELAAADAPDWIDTAGAGDFTATAPTDNS